MIKARSIGHAVALARRYRHLRTTAANLGQPTYSTGYRCRMDHEPERITETGECAACAAVKAMCAASSDSEDGMRAYDLSTATSASRARVALVDMVQFRDVCKPNDAAVGEFLARHGLQESAANGIGRELFAEMESLGFTRAHLAHDCAWRVVGKHRDRFLCSTCDARARATARKVLETDSWNK